MSGRDRKEGVCDVCKLVDKDETPKVVGYCGMCGAWLCEGCRASPGRRARAAGLRAAAKFRAGLGG